MTRNLVSLIIAVLAVTSIALGYRLYQERQKTEGVEIHVGDHGISIEQK
ncbi:hypothetical protein [Pinisolibacter aquiterrae]|nr:hypothetical protein [Pinisolibacter aquiterrae]MBV5262500.1 hypothetical protein [Pinisolibacter aquiterrae]MCC8235865.1 hypothetical protein [Pinisolibacter aquiterrae]